MAKVTCLPNGPYLIEGLGEVVDSAGKSFDLGGKAKVALCRCGHSRTKPFCDGAHKAGFVAEDAAPRKA